MPDRHRPTGPRPAALPPFVPVRGGARRPARRGRGDDALRSRRRCRPATSPEGALDPRSPARPRTTSVVDGLADARAGLGRPLLIGGALTSAAMSIAGAAYVAWRAQPPGPRLDGAGRPGRRPGRGSPDAHQAAVVPCPARRLPGRPVDEVPDLRGDAVQQAARQGAPGLPELRPPLPAVGRRRGSSCCSTTGRGASATPACNRSIALGFVDQKAYPDRLAAAQTATGMRDAAVWGTGAHRPAIAGRASASWTSGSWAARWARSSARR